MILLLTGIVLFIGCSTDDDWDGRNGNSGTLIEFNSLTAEHDTVPAGGSTKITAKVDGILVRYIWSANSGDILGSGYQVTWVAPSCGCVDGVVNCKAHAGGRVLEKTITIIVDD
jgi:hypothetical protein